MQRNLDSQGEAVDSQGQQPEGEPGMGAQLFPMSVWLPGSGSSDHPNQAFSQRMARRKGTTFPWLLCLLHSRALGRPRPTLGLW